MSEKHKHAPVAWATRLYSTAYHAGHHDTVEGCYTHVYPQDMGSYHEDVVQEWLADNPQPAPDVQGEPAIRRLGIMGAAFDPPSVRRAYTYSDQPNNTTAWKLGRVACKERSGGDFIDYGLQLLQHLQDEGFGVFEVDESDPSPQPAEQNPALDVPGLTEALRQYQHNDGSGMVFGYDKLLVDRYVAGLVEALECALETMENVDGANDCSRGIDAVEEALAAHRKQGGGV